MRAKTILSMLFLVSLGVVVTLYFKSLPQRVSPSDPPAGEFLDAAVPLAPGTLLRARDVVWGRSVHIVESGQILRPSTAARERKPDLDDQTRAGVYGDALRVGVAAGEPIRWDNIVKPGDHDFLQIVLPPKARAITIPIGAGIGLLSAGDRVDVILTQTFKDNIPFKRRSVGETVVEDLRVLMVDGGDPRSVPVSRGSGHMVTLEVTPEQAEKINVAAELGKLSLSLRGGSSGPDQPIAASMTNRGRTMVIKPAWADDVSPALDGIFTSEKTVATQNSAVEIFHGSKREIVKPE